jgi:hypothetical protein
VRAVAAELLQHGHVHVLQQLVRKLVAIGNDRRCGVLDQLPLRIHRDDAGLVVADGRGFDYGHGAQQLQALQRLQTGELEDQQAVLGRAVRVAHYRKHAAAVVGHVPAVQRAHAFMRGLETLRNGGCQVGGVGRARFNVSHIARAMQLGTDTL